MGRSASSSSVPTDRFIPNGFTRHSTFCSAVWCGRLESAGGGLRVYSGGKWLAAMTHSEIANVDEQRRVLAGLTWDARYGDRHTSLVALACGARPEDFRRALEAALLTDAEMADPGQWHHYGPVRRLA